MAQLTALDEKWDKILNELKQEKCMDMKVKENNVEMLGKANIREDLLPKVNRTLYVSLLQYTTGDPHAKVVSNGTELALESYKQLFKKGENATTINSMKIMHRTLQPEVATSLGDVEAKVDKWKEDRRYMQEMRKDFLTREQLKTIFIGMMPEEISDHLIKTCGDKSYEQLEEEAFEIIERAKDKPSRKKPLGSVGQERENPVNDDGKPTTGMNARKGSLV